MFPPTTAPSSEAPELEPIAPPQSAPEQKPQPDPVKPAENWQERFAGLQRAFNSERDSKTALQTQLNAANARTSELERALEDAGKTTSTLTTDLQSEKERIAALEGTTARHRLIMEKFPHLAAFEGEGLLPQADMDKLEDTLTKFQAKLANEQTMKNLLYQQGGVPTPPAPPKGSEDGGDTAQVILAKAVDANVKGDHSTYESLMKEYYRKVSIPLA